ncbi:FMN-binding protein [Companilactobacillus jidongensis]|uniref:FMN-binding protein n=1 Tax=Companilactobacillus jidongensis TaxID=2486006 RepID=UPI000F79E836|nr:FMN-binding protein [Companilactobacillus jidongensis]
MIKKAIGITLSFGVAVAMAIDGYIVFFKDQKTNTSTTSAETTSKKNATQTTSKSSSSSNSTDSNGQYKDGTYTGRSTSTQWGDVQVQITIKDGKLTAINVLKSPDTENKSVQINEQALPTYKSEAITAQSSKIQQISGATETYKGFTGSLQNALNQAEQ